MFLKWGKESQYCLLWIYFNSFTSMHQQSLLCLACQDMKYFLLTFIISSRISFLKSNWHHQEFSYNHPKEILSTPTYIIHHALVTNHNHQKSSKAFSFDTNGIQFIIDNSATGIICNNWSLFKGALWKVYVSVTTCSGTTSKPKYIGTFCCELENNARVRHKYLIPDALFDPNLVYNLIGVPFLGNFFGQLDDPPTCDNSGPYVTSSANKSHLVWNHGKHEQHWHHGPSKLPKIYLYQGNPYFNVFCSCIRTSFKDHIHFAFSSAISTPSETPELYIIPNDDSEIDQPPRLTNNSHVISLNDDISNQTSRAQETNQSPSL